MAHGRECQVLFELFSSPRGRVSVGRLELSAPAGRIVMLRELAESARAQIAPAARIAATFTHPELLKVLGVVSEPGRAFLASEYVPGVSLFELVAAVRRRQLPMATDAAVRIVIDALRASAAARALLSARVARRPRLLYPDCIWIAEFGDTLLAEPGIAAQLVSPASPGAELDPDSEPQDALAAAVELFHLATGRLMTGDMCASARLHLSAPLAEVLEEVFSAEPSSATHTASGFAAALSALPPALVGTEASVAAELTRLVGDLLAERRRRLDALGGGGRAPDIDAPTRVYSAPAPERDDAEVDETTRRMDVRTRGRGERARAPEPTSLAVSRPAEAPRAGASPASEPSSSARPPVVRRRPRFWLLERALLGVLVVLVVVALELALHDPARVRELYAALRSWI